MNEPSRKISICGTKEWQLHNKLHRTDSPAIKWADGTKKWFVNGQLHRTDGPAIEDANGDKEWWYKGKKISEKKFNSKDFQVKIMMES